MKPYKDGWNCLIYTGEDIQTLLTLVSQVNPNDSGEESKPYTCETN